MSDPGKHRILVVDDNELNRDMLSRRLERKDFHVETAEGGRKALEMLAAHSYDLILLDIMMPDMSGVEVLREIRAKRSAAELPVIMATAKSDSEDMVQALELGANDYVTKPIDFPVLMARVQAHLRVKKKAEPAAPAAVGAAKLIEEGLVLADAYRLDARIGAGGFGTVFRARHLKLARDVAVKVLHGSMAEKPSVLARFEREAISSCRVKHPNAVMVIDYGVTQDKIAYLVMELLEGKPLSEVLRRDGPMKPARCAEILAPVCRVLEEVHAAGVIHRDLKPGNIFLERLHGKEVVKVVDFGIAKLMGEEYQEDQAALTMEGTILGTPAYMAPERLKGEPYDGRSDVYSVGILLFEMLMGRQPFKSEQGGPIAVAMMQLNDPPPPLVGFSPELAALVTDALAKDPTRRPTAGEFARRLEAAVAG